MALQATDRDRVKTWMRESGHGDEVDDRVDVLIPGVSRWIEALIGTPLELAERVETFHRPNGSKRVVLAAYPLEEGSTPEIKYASDRDFDAADAYDSTLYFVDAASGVVHFDATARDNRRGVWQATYTAGLAGSLTELEANHPNIVTGATLWVGDWYAIGHKLQHFPKAGSSAHALESGVPKAALQMILASRIAKAGGSSFDPGA